MQLSRDAIQRMIGGNGYGASSVGGGGNGGGISTDFAFANFVALDYWNQIFVVHGKQTVTVTDSHGDPVGSPVVTDVELPPNQTPSTTTSTDSETGNTTTTVITIESVEVKYNFWGDGGVSALGTNGSGGGGGGDTLGALLANINDSSIGDIAPTASEVGKCLIYNGNNSWAWATPGGGSGGLTYGLSWSYGSVTSSSGDSYDGSASKTFIIPKNTSDLNNNAGFVTSSALSSYLPLTGGTMSGALTMSGQNGAIIMAGKNIYLGTSGSSSNASGDIVFRYGNESEKARIWVDDTFSSALGPQYRCYNTSGQLLASTRLVLATEISDMATQTWVGQQGYLTSSSISDMATKTWVTNQGYLTSLSGYSWWGATMSGSSVNGSITQTSGNIYMRYNNPHIYMGSNDKNIIDYTSSTNILAIGYSGPSTTSIRGGSILLKDASGNDMAKTATLASKKGIVGSECIGVDSKFMFTWSTELNGVVVTDTSGNAVNFCSLGGISALGAESGSGLGDLAVGKLTINTGTDGITLKDATNGDAYIKLNSGGNITFNKNLITTGQVTAGTAVMMTNYIRVNDYVRFEAGTGTLKLQMRTSTSGSWVDKDSWTY